MYQKIYLIAIVALAIFHSGHCLGICKSKIGLPIAVSPMTLPMAIGLSCGEPVSNCGPEPVPLPIIQAPPVTVPTVEGPIIPLPSPPIPCPRTIAHRCVCTKTVVKPQLIQRCITIPTVQRYLKRTYTPVLENIAYKAKPKCCSCACNRRPSVCLPRPPVCACRPPAPVCVPPPPPPVPMALPISRIC